jgi:hypothetical protein
MRAVYYVTNRETRQQSQDRFIAYDLRKPLPDEWEEWSLDDKGIWLNENADFIDDSFSDIELGDMEEETISVGRDQVLADS